MSDNSTNLQLPYLAAGQAQKHVTVNESLRRLDALVQLAAVSATTSAQPGSPSDGNVYILPAGKTGAQWGAMADGAIAYYRDGAWEQITPREGWLAFVQDADKLYYYSGSAWAHLLGPYTFIDQVNGYIGVNTNAPAGALNIAGSGFFATVLLDGFSDVAAYSGGLHGRRARGTQQAPAAVLANDALMIFGGRGYGASGFSSGTRANIGFFAAENWSDTAQGAYMVFRTTPLGANATQEAMRVSPEGRLGVGGVTAPACALDVNGPARVKSYTVAGLPSASAGAGQIIYVSNESGGAVLAFSDGTNWRRVTDRAVVS